MVLLSINYFFAFININLRLLKEIIHFKNLYVKCDKNELVVPIISVMFINFLESYFIGFPQTAMERNEFN